MVKSPIRVFVRTRPVANSFSKNLNINDKEASINLNIPRNEARGHINHLPENWNFKFDGILANSSQETVFDTVARETIQSALEGFSGTIFCYGQTGAGKTFTMSGSTSSYQQRGIIPRTISALFQEIAARPNEQFEVKVSYLEIYNEIMIDLLGESQEGGITINESGKGGIVLKGLNQIPCKKEEESLNLLFEGEYNKSMANHKLNQNSSRSHSIFTLYIQSKCKMGSTKKITSSKINLVDLAGSERTKKTGSGGQTLIEANYINKSLSFLEQVVIALCEKQRDHVPYRQSKLTYLLKDSLGGNCKTVMIANIWPEASNLEETISTLKFATRIRNVSNEATANVWLDAASPQKKYELQQSLCFSDLLSNEPLTFQEQREQQKIAREFLNGRINDIEVKSHPQVKELFHQFRNMYRELYDATKDFFHLIPSDKLKKLGIKLDNLNATDKTITLMADQSQRQEINEDFEDLLGNALRGNLSPKKELRLRIEPQISLNSLKSSINEGYMSKIRSQTGSISVRSKEDEGEFEDKEFEKKFFRRVAQTIRERSRSRGTDEKQKRKTETAEFKFPNNEKEEEFHLETEEEMHAEININEIKQRAKVRAEVLNNIKSKNFLHGLDDRRTKSLATEYTEEFPLTEHPLLSPKASLGANQNRNIKVGLNPQAAEGKAQSLLQKQQVKPDHRNKV